MELKEKETFNKELMKEFQDYLDKHPEIEEQLTVCILEMDMGRPSFSCRALEGLKETPKNLDPTFDRFMNLSPIDTITVFGKETKKGVV